MMPSASVTTMKCRASSATEVSAARSSGSTRCERRAPAAQLTCVGVQRSGRVAPVGVEPGASTRGHERATSRRGSSGGRSPESTASCMRASRRA